MTLGRRFLITALLDFVTCALGAGIVLFMISATTVPKSSPTAGGRSLVVRAVLEADSTPAEVGIEYRAPGATQWTSLPSAAGVRYSSPSDSESGGEAFLVVRDPVPGEWGFRTYLRDYARDETGKPVATSVRSRIRILGEHRVLSTPPVSVLLTEPGIPSEPAHIFVESSPGRARQPSSESDPDT